MKAKMPHKPTEQWTYLCNVCDTTFYVGRGPILLKCPHCQNTNPTDFVAIYVPDNPEENKMYTEDDWHGG